MRILHIIPGDNFTEGMAYKDNFLAAINFKDGHDAMILSSCATWINSEIEYIEPCDYIMSDGVRLVRKQYKFIINDYLTKKLRILKDTYKVIEEFKPDVIRVLNPHNLTLPIVAKYKKNNPSVKLYVDSHQHYFNSGVGFVSYWIFHKLIIGNMFRNNLKYIDKVFYCAEGVKVFLKGMYRITEEKMEFFSLGGLIVEGNKKEIKRSSVRKALNLNDNDIVLVHSGKMAAQKKTREILDAFLKVNSDRLKLLIVGSIPSEMENVLLPLIKKDSRIQYLGWKSDSELFDIISSGDLYLQPGSGSVTVHQALCSGSAVIVSTEVNGYDLFINRNTGWYASTSDEMFKIFSEIVEKPEILTIKGANSLQFAKEYFDYKKLAARLYE